MRQSLLRGSPTRERTDRMSELQNTPNTIELAAEIVSAFVSNNSVPMAELPTLIGSVHDALTKTANGLAQQPAEEPKAPAVSIKKSVQPDYIVCLDDGKRFKSLKRHLHRMLGRRKKVQVAEAASADDVQPDPRPVSDQVGSGSRLS